MQNLQSAPGGVAIIALAFIISENRRAVPFRVPNPSSARHHRA
jgi:nucleoside permease NupC